MNSVNILSNHLGSKGEKIGSQEILTSVSQVISYNKV